MLQVAQRASCALYPRDPRLPGVTKISRPFTPSVRLRRTSLEQHWHSRPAAGRAALPNQALPGSGTVGRESHNSWTAVPGCRHVRQHVLGHALGVSRCHSASNRGSVPWPPPARPSPLPIHQYHAHHRRTPPMDPPQAMSSPTQAVTQHPNTLSKVTSCVPRSVHQAWAGRCPDDTLIVWTGQARQ